jgi:hypothetical protein
MNSLGHNLNSQRHLCVLCGSAVNPDREKLTAETPRARRLRRENLNSKAKAIQVRQRS